MMSGAMPWVFGRAAKRRKLAGERAEPGGGRGEVPERQVKGAKKPFVAQQVHAVTYRAGQFQSAAGSFGYFGWLATLERREPAAEQHGAGELPEAELLGNVEPRLASSAPRRGSPFWLAITESRSSTSARTYSTPSASARASARSSAACASSSRPMPIRYSPAASLGGPCNPT